MELESTIIVCFNFVSEVDSSKRLVRLEEIQINNTSEYNTIKYYKGLCLINFISQLT